MNVTVRSKGATFFGAQNNAVLPYFKLGHY